VGDLPHDHAVVEAILDGGFKPTYWAQQMLPDHLFAKYPQLADEHAKRAHRRAYHAELAARRQRRALGVVLQEQLMDLCGKVFRGVRLGQQVDVGIKTAVVNDCVLSVTGCEQDWQVRPPFARTIGENATVYTSREHDIREQ
jgi:hypothetical protein